MHVGDVAKKLLVSVFLGLYQVDQVDPNRNDLERAFEDFSSPAKRSASWIGSFLSWGCLGICSTFKHYMGRVINPQVQDLKAWPLAMKHRVRAAERTPSLVFPQS